MFKFQTWSNSPVVHYKGIKKVKEILALGSRTIFLGTFKITRPRLFFMAPDGNV